MYCDQCGAQVNKGASFCPSCGSRVGGGGGPAGGGPSRQRSILIVVISALAVVVVGLGIILLTFGGRSGTPAQTTASAPDAAQSTEQKKDQKKQDEKKADEKKDEKEQAKQTGPDMGAIADAYAGVLDNLEPGMFWDNDPNMAVEYHYFLIELTGDDIAELVVTATTNPSDEYGIFYWYDPEAKQVVRTNEDALRYYHHRDYWCVTPDGHALGFAGTYGQRQYFQRIHIADAQLATDESDETFGTGSSDFGEITFSEVGDRSAIDNLRKSNATGVQDGSEKTESAKQEQQKQSQQESAEQEHQRLREEAEAQGLQVATGTVRITTVEERANEIDSRLAGELASEAGNQLALVFFDEGAATVTGKSGDGMGQMTKDTESLEITNADELGLADGDHVCIGMNAGDLQYSSSVRYDLVPVQGPVSLIYKD